VILAASASYVAAEPVVVADDQKPVDSSSPLLKTCRTAGAQHECMEVHNGGES
jgi:hypothetical protein